MRIIASVILWLGFATLWAFGTLPEGAVSFTPASKSTHEAFYASSGQTFSLLRHTTSTYEAPTHVRLPAEPRHAARTASPLLSATVRNSCLLSYKNTSQESFHPVPEAARSADRYIYGLRKIVV